MKKVLSVALIVCAAISVSAKEIRGTAANQMIKGTNRIFINDKNGFPTFIYMAPGQEIAPALFQRWMRAAFHSTNQLGWQELYTSKDESGKSHVHYIETWNGVPVTGSMWITHIQNGKIISCNGWFVPVINSTTDYSISESVALGFALSDINAQTYRWQSPVYEQMAREQQQSATATWYPKGELYYASVNGDNKNFRLCYRFDVYAISPLSRNYIYVDANTGEIISKENRIHTADVLGTAHTQYLGIETITTDSFAGGYRLREAGRGNGIETYNMLTGIDYAAAVDFTDADNDWNNVNAAMDEYATDAHYGAEMTYDYYMLNHNRNSIDDAGMLLYSYVHYDVNYSNAFWDGAEMTYGDGNNTPFTALDVCGHEITHGVTEHTCNLAGGGEPGAMNEGFSDCIGTAIEYYAGGATADWTVGEDLGFVIRDMANPANSGNPDTYQGNNWDFITQEVHQNSTIISHWFYLLSVGGTGTNDNGYTYNVPAHGIATASDIAYNAWRDYMFSNAQYIDARQATLNSATDLFGACSSEVLDVAEGWHAVGVGGAFNDTVNVDFSQDITTSCTAPATFIFQNLSSNVSVYNWDFGDGTTSTAINPSHTYTSYGTYDVKLTGSGNCGNDSVLYAGLIQIDSTLPCVYMMPLTGSSTLTSCSGLLYDDGGPSGNYQNNEDVITTIAPPGATGLTLTFTSFNYENNYDYLYIYDGPSTASPLIGQYDNNNLPNGGTIVASGNSLTLESTSDQGLVLDGFAASWQCTTALPGVDFITDFTSTCSGDIHFTDLTTNSPQSWLWNFGDGFTSTLQNPSHNYAANGTYTVTLTVTNAIGTDSLVQTNLITVNHPNGPVGLNGNNCATGTVDLNATGGGGSLVWFDAPTGGNQVGTGSTFTTPYLSSTTNYYVEEEVIAAPIFGGAPDNTIGLGGNYNNPNNDRFEYFDVYAPIHLTSVVVYAQGTANRTFQLLDAGGNILLDTTINVADGTQEVFLNWDLPVGTGLQIGVLATANLYRNSDGAVYPYTVPGILSITGNNANDPVRYYFLYNWKLQPASCISTRTSVTATIGNLDASISPNGNINLCGTGSVTLSGAGGAFSYNWSNGATTQSITVSSAGTYSLEVTNGTGCTGYSQTAAVSVSVSPVAAFGNTTSGFNVNFNNTSTFATTYSWDFGDGATSSNANPSHVYTVDGSYTVTLIACNGSCCDTTFKTVEIATGISSINNNEGWTIYPNPSMENFNLFYSGSGNVESLKLFNTLGQLEWSASKLDQSFWKIDAETLAAGTYFLSAKTNTGLKIFKLEKMN